MSEPRQWHELFGLAWEEFFRGTGVTVEPEFNVGLSRQLIDVVIVRPGDAVIPRPLPDGFAPLAARNVMTFKSFQDALTGWACRELVAHGVNYRKAVSPRGRLLPEGDFRLYAVSARRPAGLDEWLGVRPVSAGVYDVPVLDVVVRVVVARELPEEPQNVPIHLFAAGERQFAYALRHYRPSSPETSTLLWQLIARYGGEVPMAITLAELVRQTRVEIIESASPEVRQELLALFPPEQRLAGLPPDQLLAALSPEQRAELARLLQTPPPPAGPPNG